jgi:hypothetical protein
MSESPRDGLFPNIIYSALWHGLILLIFWRSAFYEPAPLVEDSQTMTVNLHTGDSSESKKKQTLLNTPQPQPALEKPPSDKARYFSDRDVRVEKEQIAPGTVAFPSSGTPAQVGTSQTETSQTETSQKTIPPLSQLGVGLPPPQSQSQSQSQSQQKRQSQSAKNSSGEAASIHDPEIPQGSQTLLNADQSVYHSFFSRLYGQVAPLWESQVRNVLQNKNIRPGVYESLAEVVLDQDGRFQEVIFLRWSSIPELNEAIVLSWEKGRHFPNPPKGLLNPDQQIRMHWSYSVRVDSNSGIRILPPQRRR